MQRLDAIIAICGISSGRVPLLAQTLVAGTAALLALACIVAALRMLARPGEAEHDHPKRRILAPDR
jgi:hypothetical protein